MALNDSTHPGDGVVFMFAGQGTQYPGMTGELYRRGRRVPGGPAAGARTAGPPPRPTGAAPPLLYEEVPLLRDRCTLALAGRGHFVVAGETGTLARAAEYLDERGLPHRRLPVRVGFHSSLIEPAREAYLKAVVGRDPGRPIIPLVSCCAAGVVTGPLPAAHLWDAISRPMRVLEAL